MILRARVLSLRNNGASRTAFTIANVLLVCSNAAVGPNGHGKSNVIDAIRFVFGDQFGNMRAEDKNQLIYVRAMSP